MRCTNTRQRLTGQWIILKKWHGRPAGENHAQDALATSNTRQRLTRRFDFAGFSFAFSGARVCLAGGLFELSGSGGGAPASCKDAVIKSSPGRTPSMKTNT